MGNSSLLYWKTISRFHIVEPEFALQSRLRLNRKLESSLFKMQMENPSMSILNAFKLFSLGLHLVAGPFLPSEVLFESIESKTSNGGPVFNKISLEQTDTHDVWTMKQSHHGKHAKNWDLIQIKVHTKNKTATYHQLDKEGKEIEFKTSCFRCHAGGPRYIRPKAGLSFTQKLQVQKWNWLIKSYGDIKNSESKAIAVRKVPFNESKTDHPITIKSCTHCHYQGGPRAPLTSAHKLTIKHLIKTKQMPPWPYKMTKKDQKALKRFIYGF